MNGSQNHPYRKRESSNEWSKSTTGEISNGQEGDGNNWKFLNLQLISHFPKRIPSNIVHVMNRIFFASDSLSVYFSNHLHHHPINPLWAPSDHSFKISLVGQLYGCHSGWQLFFPFLISLCETPDIGIPYSHSISSCRRGHKKSEKSCRMRDASVYFYSFTPAISPARPPVRSNQMNVKVTQRAPNSAASVSNSIGLSNRICPTGLSDF